MYPLNPVYPKPVFVSVGGGVRPPSPPSFRWSWCPAVPPIYPVVWDDHSLGIGRQTGQLDCFPSVPKMPLDPPPPIAILADCKYSYS